ncbi:MAG: hypothetical protein FWH37_06860 [Candidatus Bathyarchaeota archaeon]|nr:hypothetical protein [Candidatus Termiticorpusculum sp.]
MKTKQINDERIQKNLEKSTASAYPALLILTTIVLIMKIALKLHPLLYLFETIALITSLSYYAISTAWKNVLFVKIRDEAIIDIRNKTKGKSYMLLSFIVFGQVFVPILSYFYHWIPEAQIPFALFSWLIYLFICGLPLSIAGSKMRKKEPLVVWNSETSKARVLKNFKRVFIIVTVYNIVMQTVLYLFTSQSLSGTVVAFVLLEFMVIFMCFEVRRNLLRDEKRANKMVEFAEKTVEEVDDYEK